MNIQSNFRQSSFRQSNFSQSLSRQRGVALVVSLIILVSLTMLGLTAIQRTTTDLSMAGNQREAGLMFQSAEVGLTAAENFIINSDTNADFANNSANAALGLYTVNADDPAWVSPDYFNGDTWDNNSQTATTTLGTIQQPRYMIEYLGDRQQNALGGISIGGYGGGAPGDNVSIYRTTTRGAGLTGNSFRYIQSYYGKSAP